MHATNVTSACWTSPFSDISDEGRPSPTDITVSGNLNDISSEG
ncbi:MAG: hypothetical protein ACKE51_04600 [Methylococcaceae bacterium]